MMWDSDETVVGERSNCQLSQGAAAKSILCDTAMTGLADVGETGHGIRAHLALFIHLDRLRAALTQASVTSSANLI